MVFRLKFKPAASKDLYKIAKKNKELGANITNRIIPEILKNPLQGRMKQGDLKKIRSKDFYFKGVSYRILYEIEGEIIRIYAAGVHDVSYRKAKSRSS
ncbi:MAG: type II toxin-antitoxin system RelE/ParE family toxin [Pseudomonadota bacterium]